MEERIHVIQLTSVLIPVSAGKPLRFCTRHTCQAGHAIERAHTLQAWPTCATQARALRSRWARNTHCYSMWRNSSRVGKDNGVRLRASPGVTNFKQPCLAGSRFAISPS